MAFEAMGTIQLGNDPCPMPHEFFITDGPDGEVFGGILENAVSHFKANLPGVVNLRVVKVGRYTPVAAPAPAPAKTVAAPAPAPAKT